jgi:hypothetical protein
MAWYLLQNLELEEIFTYLRVALKDDPVYHALQDQKHPNLWNLSHLESLITTLAQESQMIATASFKERLLVCSLLEELHQRGVRKF